MTKGLKFIFGALVVIIAVLSTTSGFFYSKSSNLEKEKVALEKASQVVTPVKVVSDTTKTDVTETPETATSTTPTTTETKTEATLTEPAPMDNRPSRATDTYTILSGDTLYSIGKKFDLSWSSLADANGITDINMIKVGQILMIPKNNVLNYTVTSTKAQSLQESADSGKISFRLSPVETVKSDISPAYGILVTDVFKEKSIDKTAGTATVTATHNDLNYEIKLIQPITKGDKGIWAIESVKSVTTK